METLLQNLIADKKNQGVDITFFEAPKGDKKNSIIKKVPIKAVLTLSNNPDAVVVAMPDLYPYNRVFPHETYQQLEAGIKDIFLNEWKRIKGKKPDVRTAKRFFVFCFKHDLEALLLAAEEALRSQLDVSRIKRSWKIPVEDQNEHTPPKYVIEKLFKTHNKKYKDTVDAPLILSKVSYQDLCEMCPQCFEPFVTFLENAKTV